ncbi:primosomal protein [Microbacterium sp. BK668]|uniref:primosomal protein n=1 Tax=Microbacterium sp. BK668 TaxID=2512118 RepID=UPI0010E9A618|nr:primosomal protein [Microbacterium sp. BK668]TDN93274.1 hypothetical protein EV279_2818 [Microbacterium sp. BK668]
MADREPRDDEREHRPRSDRPRGTDPRSNSGSGESRREPRDDHRARRSENPPRRSSSAGDAKSYGRSGDRDPHLKREGSKPYGRREDAKPYAKRDSGKPYERREGSKPYGKRDGGKPYERREGSKPYGKRDGDKPYERREGSKPYGKRDGDKPYERREGSKPYAKRDGDKPFGTSGDRKPYPRREGDKPHGRREASRSHAPREGHSSRPRQDRPTRGGADRPDRATRPEEIRSIRPRHDDPVVPDEITARDLPAPARNELKTLSKENADWVARHLAMAAQLIEDDPELAHQHALSASRRAGRIAVVRETLAITAYATGDFALALRELRTYRRISGREDQIALMVDSERGVGRPDRALEVGRAVDRSILPVPVRVELAIAMSGARLDLGEPERALAELEIPEFDADRAYEWTPALFAARAAVLEELGRDDEARRWQERAIVAAEALDEASGVGDLEVIEVEEVEEVVEVPLDEDDGVAGDAPERELSADEPVDVTVADAAPAAGGAGVTIDDEVREILEDAGIDGADDADDADGGDDTGAPVETGDRDEEDRA